MIFAFMDESGHPHPNDAASRPVLVSVCIDATKLRTLNTEIFSLKRQLLQKEPFDFEMKARKLITPATFRNRPEKREFVEAFFESLRNLDVVVFAEIMERPSSIPTHSDRFLPLQFRHQLQTSNRFVEVYQPNDLAAIMFDGDGTNFGPLAVKFSNWLYRTVDGKTLTNLAESPFFVDSRVTPGIQIADMIASVIRQFEERELYLPGSAIDSYSSAIARYHQIVREKSIDMEAPQGDSTWHGFNRMPEWDHYAAADQ